MEMAPQMETVAQPATPAAPARVEMRAAAISLGVSIALVLVKFTAYFLTRSNAIFSDALENIVNVLGSGFALYSVILSHRPADKEHPYGHGKVEFFSAGLEGGMILLASILIVAKVVNSYFYPQRPVSEYLTTALIMMGAALAANGGLGLYLWQSGRRSGSLTLEANGMHLLTDAIDSMAVLVALIVVRLTGWQWVDGVAAILVAVYISYLSLGLLKRSASGLMDEQDAGDQKLLRRLLDNHMGPAGKEPRICSYHKLRHRHSGRYHWVDFHIVVPAWWNIDRGHQVASAIEYEIELALGEGNATAHVEPCVQEACGNCAGEKGGHL
jgi:cation diffusion facilitator family transporter